MRSRFFSLFIILMIFVLIGAGCGGPSSAERLATTPITLTVWRVFDDETSMREIMRNYQTLHPNVSFEYRELRVDEYEDELIRAFAEGNGPDIFSLHNTWIGAYENLIAPMPSSVEVAFTETRGSIKKETVYTLEERPTIRPAQLKRQYIDVVSQDVVRPYRSNANAREEDRIFGLPLSVDTLALFYNQDLLNAAGIPQPAAAWSEVQEHVPELTTIGINDRVVQPGIALGTSQNVERAFDILSLLMMQNGTPMIAENNRATFADRDSIDSSMQALNFYTDFGNPLKQVYSWNEEQPGSFEAFANGNLAYFLGYSYHVPFIDQVAPKLNYNIAPVPQIEGGRQVNHANYWVETVAKSTENRDWAWDFVQFATSEEQVPSYLEATGKPTALRSLISGQLDEEFTGIFAGQLLTSRSWYRGDDAGVAEQAFLDLIDEALVTDDVPRAISDAQNKVNQTF